MVKGFSKVILMGNLTRDPEVRTTTNGANITSFSVAVNRTYRNSAGEMVEDVSYINCSAWGGAGETIAKYLHRGSGILVSGRLQQRSWDDEKTGQKRSAVDVVVEEFNFVGGRDDNVSYDGGYSDAKSSSRGSRSSAKGKKSANEDVLPDDVEIDKEPEIDLDGVPF